MDSAASVSNMECNRGRDTNLKALRSSIVRLRYYKKAGAASNENYKRYKNIYKKLYFLAITPNGKAIFPGDKPQW